MFCQSYRQPLRDAAVSGELLSRKLATHLASCKACSAAFAAEKALFAAIDGSLHAAANAKVPALLIPGVRSALLERPLSAGALQWRAILVFATAFLIVGMLSMWHSRRRSPSEKSRAVASLRTPAANHEGQFESPARVPSGAIRTAARKGSVTPAIAVQPAREVNVVVWPEDDEALRKYAILVNANIGEKVASDVATWKVGSDLDPMEIAEIDLSQLAIQPLESGEAD